MASPLRRTAGGLALAALLSASQLTAQVSVTLEPSRDNTLYEDAAGAVSNGAGSRLFVGVNSQSSIRRAVLYFDLAAALPRGAVITGAELRLFAQSRMGGTQNLTLHRMTRDWGEGSSVAGGGQGGGGAAAAGDATWIHSFFPGRNWTQPGGDFLARASANASTTQTNRDAVFASSTQLVADVQSFLDRPSSNFGWLARTEELLAGNVASYGTREGSTGDRPELAITYTVASPAANIAFGSGCSGSGTRALALSANSLPTVPNALYGLQLTGGPAAPLGRFVAFSLARARPPLTAPFFSRNCVLELDLNSFLGDAAVPAIGPLTLPIPNDRSLVGSSLIAQGFAAETSGFVTTSNGLEVLFGL